MSPYCPTCLGVAREREVRCPLDRQFLRKRKCFECDNELYPRELYCADCGHLNREPEEILLIPPEATPFRQLGSIFLDGLALGVLVIVAVWSWSPLLGLVLFPLSSVGYRAVGRSGGRQTFGQAVFGVATVGPNAGPATLSGAVRRSLWEVVKIPQLLLRRPEVEETLERRSRTLEISLV